MLPSSLSSLKKKFVKKKNKMIQLFFKFLIGIYQKHIKNSFIKYLDLKAQEIANILIKNLLLFFEKIVLKNKFYL